MQTKKRKDFMKIAYLSITGNVRSFIDELNVSTEDLIEIDDSITPQKVNDKFLLFVPTYDDYMTESLDEFLDEDNSEDCLGIIASGNRNFGAEGYVFTAKNLSKKYEIPLLHDFEYAGLTVDIKKVMDIIAEQK